MKKVLLLMALGFSPVAFGKVLKSPEVSLAWDAPPDKDIIGYKLYYGKASGIYEFFMDIPKAAGDAVPPTTGTIAGLTPNTTYYFAVTAYNADLESDPSAEISWTSPNRPGAPMNLRIKITQNNMGKNRMQLILENGEPGLTATISATEDFKAWTPIGRVFIDTLGQATFIDENSNLFTQRFYKAGI